jgi:hypothetical protein
MQLMLWLHCFPWRIYNVGTPGKFCTRAGSKPFQYRRETLRPMERLVDVAVHIARTLSGISAVTGVGLHCQEIKDLILKSPK